MPYAKLPPDFPEPEPLPKEFWEDEEWVNENYTELVQKYPDQWIAVYDKEVIVANKYLGEVEKVVQSKNFPRQCVYSYVEGTMRVYGHNWPFPKENLIEF